ncbi:hypothetical protein PsorP6_016129 [Peronosclerospora sorghi]|uniref:Uncharacterized protein n=1 Tax=Peronosclerospora sorghi TaxID=230839 RepID=A0ACC0VR32_9STRA|nr:hypothetical protein PsorP6_016129 [Peronosclerospora sorghi]
MATDDKVGCKLHDSVDDEEDREEPGSNEDTEAQHERTLFILNLSFQTTEDELRDFFLAFGAVEYARLVYEKGSGLSKCVGFVRFKSADVPTQVLKRGELPQVDSKQKHKSDWKRLIVSRAVSKTDAEYLLDVNTREHRRRDKRNLYLAYEGTLNVNKISDAEMKLPQMDIDKLRRAICEKKLKLQNPMYFVSPARLSVRNLSTSLDYRELKKFFHDAASTGMRAGNADLSKIKPELLSKAPNPPIKVQLAKVLRDMESAKAREKKLRALAKFEAAVEGDKTERIETNKVWEVKQQLNKRTFGKAFRAEERRIRWFLWR